MGVARVGQGAPVLSTAAPQLELKQFFKKILATPMYIGISILQLL